jgi:hypothetical protein
MIMAIMRLMVDCDRGADAARRNSAGTMVAEVTDIAALLSHVPYEYTEAALVRMEQNRRIIHDDDGDYMPLLTVAQ